MEKAVGIVAGMKATAEELERAIQAAMTAAEKLVGLQVQFDQTIDEAAELRAQAITSSQEYLNTLGG